MSVTRRPPKLPSLLTEDDSIEPTSMTRLEPQGGGFTTERQPYLLCVDGEALGAARKLRAEPLTIGRAPTSKIRLVDDAVSREHARVFTEGGTTFVEDLGSANGTFLNGSRVVGRAALKDGDKIQIGNTIFKFTLYDAFDERYERRLRKIDSGALQVPVETWDPSSWTKRPVQQAIPYSDQAALDRAVARLRKLPPLVTSWEIEELKRLLAEAQEGRRFLLQGGDCAETLDDCEPTIISNKLKILIQMSLVLTHCARRPVIRVGRFAGQYAKPRSKPTETRNGVELPSYFGDLVNRPAFDAQSRTPDPNLLVMAYYHAALTLNFIRALSGGGFADLRRPEYFDLAYFERAELPTDVKTDYSRMCREVSDGISFVQAVGDRAASELMKVTFYTSHEGLNLLYESAQTYKPPRRDRFYDLTTHMPWIGERTRQLDGAHVEFFRGVANPVGVKLGPTATPEEVVRLCGILNPTNEAGKIVLVTRMGAKNVAERLEPLVTAVRRAGKRVLWVCDPMHGNAITTRDGIKTRDFEDILREIETSMDVHRRVGSYLGGVHFELTGEDVTECIGGGLSEEDLSRNYSSPCDPRLNYRQAIQMAFALGRRLNDAPRPPSTVPPPSLE